MRQIVFFGVLLIFISSCSIKDNNDLECDIFHPKLPELYIRLVDDLGTNLIRNGTIDIDELIVEGGCNSETENYVFNPEDEFAAQDEEKEKESEEEAKRRKRGRE